MRTTRRTLPDNPSKTFVGHAVAVDRLYFSREILAIPENTVHSG